VAETVFPVDNTLIELGYPSGSRFTIHLPTGFHEIPPPKPEVYGWVFVIL